MKDSYYYTPQGRPAIRVSKPGYEIFKVLKGDGTADYCGGCVGVKFGWERVEIEKLSSQEKKKFKAVEVAKQRVPNE